MKPEGTELRIENWKLSIVPLGRRRLESFLPCSILNLGSSARWLHPASRP